MLLPLTLSVPLHPLALSVLLSLSLTPLPCLSLSPPSPVFLSHSPPPLSLPCLSPPPHCLSLTPPPLSLTLSPSPSLSPSLPPVTPPRALCAYGSCHWGRGVASRRVTGPWCLLLYVIIPPICSPQWVPHGDHEVAIVKMEAKMERGAVGGVSLHRPRKDGGGWRS